MNHWILYTGFPCSKRFPRINIRSSRFIMSAYLFQYTCCMCCYIECICCMRFYTQCAFNMCVCQFVCLVHDRRCSLPGHNGCYSNKFTSLHQWCMMRNLVQVVTVKILHVLSRQMEKIYNAFHLCKIGGNVPHKEFTYMYLENFLPQCKKSRISLGTTWSWWSTSSAT